LGRQNLGQHGQPHIRQTYLRLHGRCRYHQQYESKPHHGSQSSSARLAREETCITVRITDINRMSAANDDLGEQIVQLLPRLRRFARSLANRVQDADDLVQLAIERALSRSSQLRPEAQLSSWMFGILRNAWIDESRARGRRTRLFVPEELGENIADPAADRQADALSVQEAMARLPVEQREVIGLVLVEGLSYKEAAEIIGAPIGTITSRLARGRDSLQALLGNGRGASA
jgi:RNA polymerase sigma-70 factor (ECF subfamily)